MKIGVLTRVYNDNNNKKEFVNQSYLSLLIRYNHIPIIVSSFNNLYPFISPLLARADAKIK